MKKLLLKTILLFIAICAIPTVTIGLTFIFVSFKIDASILVFANFICVAVAFLVAFDFYDSNNY